MDATLEPRQSPYWTHGMVARARQASRRPTLECADGGNLHNLQRCRPASLFFPCLSICRPVFTFIVAEKPDVFYFLAFVCWLPQAVRNATGATGQKLPQRRSHRCQRGRRRLPEGRGPTGKPEQLTAQPLAQSRDPS